MSYNIGHEDRDDPSSRHQVETKAKIESLLSGLAPVDWNVVNGLLQNLQFASSSSSNSRCSIEYDPMGRLLLGRLLSRNPPVASLEAALAVFPDSLSHNPAAFFTACRDATPKIAAHMMRHVLKASNSYDNVRDECPYPWIISNHISIEGAKAILEVYPQGALQKSSFLSSYCPLDFFLMSEDMMEQRNFGMTLWHKFKLMLVAAECCDADGCDDRDCGLSPVQMILKRVLSRPDLLDNMKRAQHVLWLLHQLRWTDQWVFEKQTADGKYPLHFVLSHKCTEDPSGLVAARELVKILLEAHPMSAKHLVNGRLALHMAIDNGWPCHDLLLAVCPEALDAPDPRTELFPFQSAAKEEMAYMSLDVTFELLRANPTHARSLGKEGARVGA